MASDELEKDKKHMVVPYFEILKLGWKKSKLEKLKHYREWEVPQAFVKCQELFFQSEKIVGLMIRSIYSWDIALVAAAFSGSLVGIQPTMGASGAQRDSSVVTIRL